MDILVSELLPQVKSYLGLEEDDFSHDQNLLDYIMSCIEDMKSSGIAEEVIREAKDARVKDLIKLYCRTMFDNVELPPIYHMNLQKLALSYPAVK